MHKNAPLLIVAGVFYLLIGLLWAVTFGINMMEIRASGGERTYDHQFFDVVSAGFDDETLWLCVVGRRMHHPDEPAETSEFALSVPVELLWTDPEQARSDGFYRPWWGEYVVNLPSRRVFSTCKQDRQGFRTLPVERLVETDEIGDYFDGFDDDELRRFLRDRSVQQEVLVIPQSFDAVHYSPLRQLVFVHSKADQNGNRFVDIDVRPQRREYVIGAGEFLKAFLIDALTYPYQLFLWISYAGAH